VLKQANFSIQATYIDQIWDIVITQSNINLDSVYFFDWLNDILNKDSNTNSQVKGTGLSDVMIEDFFKNKVITNEKIF
jgi:hypothetical protein